MNGEETRQWSRPTPKGDIPEPRSNHSCALIGNTLYLQYGNISVLKFIKNTRNVTNQSSSDANFVLFEVSLWR